MAGSETPIEIRELHSQKEFAEAVELQRRIWGFEDIELLPVRLFVVATKVGGQAFGAYDGGRMMGFLLAIPGLKPGGVSYLHSHMLGVLPEYNNLGIGRRLKLRQREDAIERGVQLIEWTFDPLEVKNAFFNMQRLGAVVRRYVENQYGTTTSHLHGGLPTDRCTAEWWVNSERVVKLLAGAPVECPIEDSIEAPSNIGVTRRENPKLAREIQKGIAARFHELLGRGLVVVGVEKGDVHTRYLFGRWQPPQEGTPDEN